MSNQSAKFSRRNFIGSLVKGIALMGAGAVAPLATSKIKAESEILLASRFEAAPLLLNYNENSFGMSPKAVDAALTATRSFGNRYPDESVEQLRAALADMHGVNTSQIIFGNGSTEVIQAVVTMAEENNATVIEPDPTFGDVRRYSAAERLQIIRVPVGQGFQTDIIALRKQAEKIRGTVLINICNPNNPTGTIVDQQQLSSWISTAPNRYIFLIDEAYFDYAQLDKNYQSVLPLIKSGKENLILTRTFSKIYGMAGMRIGYGVAASQTASKVKKFAAGYNLSAAGTAAALASLDDDDFYQSSQNSNLAAKKELLSTLNQLELEHIPSHTNFVLHRINSKVDTYAYRMKQNGILVGRRMTKEDGWNRISLGTPNEMAIFSKVLLEFRKRAWV